MHRTTLLLATVALACACTAADARTSPQDRGVPATIEITPAPRSTPAPTSSPPYDPGPHSTGGTVAATDGRDLVLRTVENGDIDVDLRRVRSVWKETEVAASALEVGDDLFVNGAWNASGFAARYVWVGIGRIDGVIRAIDGDVLTVDATVRAGLGFGTATRRVELSRYVTFVEPLTRADLRPGRTIGAVLYAPRAGLPRLTRIW